MWWIWKQNERLEEYGLKKNYKKIRGNMDGVSMDTIITFSSCL